MNHSDHPESEITIEDIVDSFSARLENGEHPSIEEYKQKYPQLANRIEAVLPALVVLENVDSDPGERKLAVDDSIPEILGDYQIVQEVGRGGMGIVFEAQHSTMRRKVALKVLPKSAAEKPNYLKRFLTEARSAGQLHHTNIVPVFEVGESAGLHFYSMQFIYGDNLDHVIDDIRRLRQNSGGNHAKTQKNPSPDQPSGSCSGLSQSIANALVNGTVDNQKVAPLNGSAISHRQLSATQTLQDLKADPALPHRTAEVTASKTTVFAEQPGSTNHRTRNQYHNRVAAVGVQVAEALAHAHEHGVLHRDVKPANLILDTDGNVWITDFGLAKLDAHDLTQTGDIVGTLRYMAPERFAGEADPRSDVYSLGLTLYELATLKCAFENNRGTLVQDVANSSSVISPRKIDETIPSDLETIILKAIEPQAERRYQTANEIAEDLQLFLADRPIRARRATWAEKSWRICRRNPLAATLAGCLLILLTVITAGSIQFARNEVANRKESQKNLFYSKLDQAKMRVYSGRPGQRFEAMKAIRDAVSLLPEMDFDETEIQENEFLLRSEVIAATSLTDIDRKWSHRFEPGWGRNRRYTIDVAGKYFAEGHDDGRIRIRNVADRKIKLELPGGRGDDPSWVMHFSPNARYLIAKYHQGNVHNELLTIIWDIENDGRQIYVTSHTRAYSFSDDSTKIAIAYSDRAEVFDFARGGIVKTIYPEFSIEGNVSQIKLNSDASQIAISRASSGVVEFWDIKNRPALTDVIQCEQNVFCMDWDSSREIFAAGCHRGVLHYWIGDLSSAGTAIQLHQNSIHEIHLHSQCELVATTAWDATTRFTDLVAGKEVLRMENHELAYNGFCANGRLGMLDENEEFGIWQVELPLIQTLSSPNEEAGGFTCCIHPKFNHIVGRTNGEMVEIWNLNRRQRLAEFEIGTPRQISFANSGEYFFASGSKGLKRWAVGSDGGRLTFSDEVRLVERKSGDFDLFHDGTRVLIAIGSRLKIIDATTGELVLELGVHSNLNRPRLTVDDRYALSGTWKGVGIKVWDVNTGKCIATVNPETGSAAPMPHPTDANIFYASRRNTTEFRIEEADGATAIQAMRKLKYDGPIALLNDGQKMLIQKNSYNMVLLDSVTQQELAKIVSSGQSRVIDRKVSLDGDTLVLACFDNLQIINLEEFGVVLNRLGLDWN